MARVEKLTDAKIRDLEPRDKPYFVPVPGSTLKIRVMPGGTKAFYLRWRIKQADGTLKQIGSVIGYPAGQGALKPLWLEEATARAHLLIAHGKKGIDPRPGWEAEEQAELRASQTEQFEAFGTSDPDNLEYLKTAWDNYYANKKGVTPRHLRKMKNAWKHIIEPFGENNRRLDPKIRTKALTAADINGIRDAMEDRPEEFNKFRMALSNVLRHEISAGRLEKYILLDVPLYQSKRRMTILSEKGIKEFQAFFGDLEKFAEIDRPHARFLLGLLYTGMRPITLRSLQKEDTTTNNFIDWRRGPNGMIVIRYDKTAKKRKEPFVPVPITEKAAEAMRAASAAAPWSPFIFGTADARKRFCEMPLSVKRTEQFFRLHAHRFDLEGYDKLDIYSLRHTFGSMAAAANIPLKAVGEMMLHTNVATTEKYVKLTDKSRLETVRKIEGLF